MDKSQQAPVTPTAEDVIAQRQTQNWSTFAHLAFLIDYVIPFAGMITLIFVYVLIGNRDARVRQHAGKALGFQISTLLMILASILIGAVLGLFAHLIYKPLVIVPVVVMVATILGCGIYRIVAGIQAALKVAKGEPVRYTYSFIRLGTED